MTKLRRNIAANAVSSACTGLIGLAAVPLYLHFLGPEAFGLVGFMATLQALSVLLDFGLGATIVREMARLSSGNDTAPDMRNLLRTLEVVYGGAAVVIGGLVFFAAPWLAENWIQAEQLSSALVERSVQLMGLALLMQWPFAVYAGTLTGLQNQILLGFLNVLMAGLRALGGIAVLWLVESRIDFFFASQVAVGLIGTATAAACTWRHMPRHPTQPRFDVAALKNTWRFTVGVGVISIQAVLLTQLDKILLVRMLPLQWFGYYALANTVAVNLYRLTTPLTSVFFPRLVQLVEAGNPDVLSRFYHRAAQSLSLIVIPVAAMMAAFAEPVLRLWTRNPDASTHAAPLLVVIFIGTSLNQVMAMPYLLQLASKWTRLAIVMNTAIIAVQLPALWIVTRTFGAIGGASVWLAINACYFLVVPSVMHARLLVGEKSAWYFKDVIGPAVVCAIIVLLARLLIPFMIGDLATLILLGLIYAVCLLAAAITCQASRVWLHEQFRQFFLTRTCA